MHSIETIRQIDRLLKQGDMSQRDIAAHLGVSLGIVSAIANGRRGLHGKVRDDAPRPLWHPAGTPVRCPECGYRIYLPCLVCSTREYRRQRRARATGARSNRGGECSR